MKIKYTIILTSLLVLIAGLANADIYSWTGDDGVLYFSDKPGSPNAKLYIKEDPEPVRPQIPQAPTRAEPTDKEILTDKLAATNANLNQALNRIEELTEQVEASESEAAAAAAAATVAAEEAADNAAKAADSASDSNRSSRIVYYGTPYYDKSGHKNRLSKRSHQGSHHKSLKHSFRYGNKKHGTAVKRKHHIKRRYVGKHSDRASTLKHKNSKHYRHNGNHRYKNITDRINNNRPRRPLSTSSTSRSFRSLGRKGQGS